MEALTLAYKLLLWAPPVILAITIHEVAHGVVARYYGDPTAAISGRLSLNPLRHVDYLGSIAIPALLIWFADFVFGWAKPVPVDEKYFHSPKRNMAVVAIAGPASNFIMAICWAFSMKAGILLYTFNPTIGDILILSGVAGVFINSALMMLNILPLPPLDGYRIIQPLLPEFISNPIKKIQWSGLLILIVLLVSGVMSKILWPLMSLCMAISTHIANIPLSVIARALSLMMN